MHRTKIAADATEFAVQLLRDQVGYKVYPAHRLDRKTSGILLFAKSKEANIKAQELFRDRKIQKTYTAIVRGFIQHEGLIDYALSEAGKTQEAQTQYRLLAHFEIPLAFGKFSTSRYSWVELNPLTGRFHQLRKHMAHIFHPIIGDRPHGCNKQNKLWKEQFGMTCMLLHASKLNFEWANESIEIQAKASNVFTNILEMLTQKNMSSI